MGYCDACLSAGSVNTYGYCEICGAEHATSREDISPVIDLNTAIEAVSAVDAA